MMMVNLIAEYVKLSLKVFDLRLFLFIWKLVLGKKVVNMLLDNED